MRQAAAEQQEQLECAQHERRSLAAAADQLRAEQQAAAAEVRALMEEREFYRDRLEHLTSALSLLESVMDDVVVARADADADADAPQLAQESEEPAPGRSRQQAQQLAALRQSRAALQDILSASHLRLSAPVPVAAASDVHLHLLTRSASACIVE